MEGWRITLLNEQEKTIFVDADACPVKDEILQTASEYEVQVLFVASFEHYQLSRSNEENGSMLILIKKLLIYISQIT